MACKICRPDWILYPSSRGLWGLATNWATNKVQLSVKIGCHIVFLCHNKGESAIRVCYQGGYPTKPINCRTNCQKRKILFKKIMNKWENCQKHSITAPTMCKIATMHNFKTVVVPSFISVTDTFLFVFNTNVGFSVLWCGM